MASYRRVYDSRHLQADCQEPYALYLGMGYLCLFIGNESVPKIIINNTVNLLLKTEISILLISNQTVFGCCLIKIVSVCFIWKICLYFSIGNCQPRKPALCQLYRHTFVPCRNTVFEIEYKVLRPLNKNGLLRFPLQPISWPGAEETKHNKTDLNNTKTKWSKLTKPSPHKMQRFH